VLKLAVETIGRRATDWRWLAGSAAAALVLAATACGSAMASLPDGRAYELVSPPDKNGGDVLLANSRSRASAQGEAFQFASLVGFADVHGTAVSSDYISRRTTQGWVTHGITPRQDALNGFLAVFGPGDAVYEGEFSPDLSAGVVRANAFPETSPNVATVQNLFVRRDLLSANRGTFDLLTDSVIPIPAPWARVTFPPPPEVVQRAYKPYFAGASADFHHVIFESILNLTQDTVDAGLPRNIGDDKLYEWDNGVIRNVGILPSDEGGAPVRARAGRGTSVPFTFYTHNAISSDGARIFFTNPDNGQIYMRSDGATTTRVSKSERRDPDPTPQPAQFRAATPDGSRVFFTSEELLSDGVSGGRNLWRWDAGAPEGSRLVQVSTDEVPGDESAPFVVGVLGVSNDGDWAYFIARGPLVDDMPPTGATVPVIYQWHAGRLRYVGKLRAGFLLEERFTGDPEWLSVVKTSRVTTDGRNVLWVTSEGDQLSPHDHGSCDGDPCEEIYVFSTDANSGNGRVVCVSCDPSGAPATASSLFITHVATGAALQTSHLVQPLTQDGRFAFFQTAARLVDRDKNDQFDVYEYDLVQDRLSLLSSGRADAFDSYFMDASASGRDVFFATRERLVGWDVDASYDIYDARVGGGLPEPPRPTLPCNDDQCQGTLGAPPALNVPTTRTFRGIGNVQSRHKSRGRGCRHKKARKRSGGRVRCVRKKRRDSTRRTIGRR